MLEHLEVFLKKYKRIIPVFIFVISFAIISFGINETGETWDEIPYYNAGRQYYSNLVHFNFKSTDWASNKEHPPVAKYIYGLFSLPGYLMDGEHYTGGRIASALVMSLTIALVFLFSGELFGLVVGLIAAFILMLSPPFIAYGRILGMDSVTTLAFLTLAIVCYRFARSPGRPKDYIVPSLALGLAFSTRYNTIIGSLFGPVAIILFSSWKKNWKKWLGLLLIPLGSALIFYLIWPFLWNDPVGALKISFGHWGQVKEWYLAQKDAVLPNSYFFTYYLFTTPVVVLLLMIIGIVAKKMTAQKIYILALLVLPFINSFVGIKQGGIRYLLFVWIPIAILAAFGFVHLLSLTRKRILQVVLLVLLFGYCIFNVIYHYPYYLDYYNELVGGSRGNYEKKLLQFGWWGEGSKRSVDFINQSAPEKSTVFNNMNPNHVLDNLREDLHLVAGSENPDYIVFNTSWQWASNYVIPPGYEIANIEKSGGAPVVTVLKRIK